MNFMPPWLHCEGGFFVDRPSVGQSVQLRKSLCLLRKSNLRANAGGGF